MNNICLQLYVGTQEPHPVVFYHNHSFRNQNSISSYFNQPVKENKL